MSDAAKPKKKREMLTSFSIIFIILALVAIITVILSKSTEAVTGATLADFVMAPVQGFADAIDVCLFVLVLGGFLGIVTKTDALTLGINKLVKKMKGKETALIWILMALFGVMGSTYGFCEETVGFYALLAATMMAAGYDAMTGAMMILLGAGVGCLGSTVNPFATGVATAALVDMGIDVPQTVVIGLGLALLVVNYIICCLFVTNYAKRVKADPSKTLMSAEELAAAEEAYGNVEKDKGDVPLSGRQKGVLAIFAVTFLIMIISFIPWEDLNVNFFVSDAAFHEETVELTGQDITDTYKDKKLGDLSFTGDVKAELTTEETDNAGWSSFLTGVPLGQWYFAESTTWFLLMAILIGIVGGLSEHEIVDEFMKGAGDIVSVVMIIAVARGVSVLMSNTGLSEFVLNAASDALAGTSGVLFAIGSYLLYFLLSFLIPSTSGMATVSMPIMGPLAAKLGFNPAVMIMVFSAASGVVNLITPTSGAIMGGLKLARVEYGTWVKFAIKIVVVTSIACMVILTIAMLTIPA